MPALDARPARIAPGNWVLTTDASDAGQAMRRALHPALPGIFLAVLTLLFGFGLGVVFGLNEGAIKSRLAASAAAVEATVYHGDAAAAKPVLDKSWAYMQRAHLHAGALGTSAVILCVLTALVGARPVVTRTIGVALGAGALGYSVFWLWAGFRAPGLGGTGAAKESLAWLAMPSSGAVVAGTAAVAVLCFVAMARRRTD